MEKKMPNKILFYGDIACDLVIKTEIIPEDGHDAAITDLDLLFGGSSANSAAVASALGADAYYMGFIGNDIYSDLLFKDLNSHNVHTDLVKNVNGKSTMIIAIINNAGDRSMLSYRGVNAEYPYEANFSTLIQDFDAIHISGYCLQNEHSRNTAIALLNEANHQKIPVSIDPSFLSSNLNSPELANLLPLISIIFPNRSEAQQLTKKDSLSQQAEEIHNLGIQLAVLKLDEEGCYISRAKTMTAIQIDAYHQSNLVNTVGAGDAFCAGFLVAHLRGLSLSEAGKIGNASAHIVLEGNGGRDHVPNKKRMKELLEKHNDSVLFQKFYSTH